MPARARAAISDRRCRRTRVQPSPPLAPPPLRPTRILISIEVVLPVVVVVEQTRHYARFARGSSYSRRGRRAEGGGREGEYAINCGSSRGIVASCSRRRLRDCGRHDIDTFAHRRLMSHENLVSSAVERVGGWEGGTARGLSTTSCDYSRLTRWRVAGERKERANGDESNYRGFREMSCAVLARSLLRRVSAQAELTERASRAFPCTETTGEGGGEGNRALDLARDLRGTDAIIY